MAAIDGLGSGLDTSTIISQLMQIERLPQNRLANKRLAVLSQGTAWEQIGNALKTLQTAATKLGADGALSKSNATSSAPGLVSVVAGAGAGPGVHTLRVQSLAVSQQLQSSAFASRTSVVGAGSLVLARPAELSGIGATGVTGGTAASGATTVSVTQASAAAGLTGSAVAASTTIDKGNNMLRLTVNGTDTTVTIANGTYTSTTLAAAVQSALTGAGVAVRVTDQGGQLAFGTTRQGSSATVVVGESPGSGPRGLIPTTANAALGLTRGSSATGTDAVALVNGTSTTIAQVDGSDLTVGGLVLTGVSSLKVGTATVTVARTTSAGATVEDLAAAVNGARGGATATAVDDGSGTTRLLLSGTTTGTGSDLQVTSSGLTGLEAGFSTIRSASDARMTLNGLPISRSGNTVDDLLPGVSLSLLAADQATDVTLSVVQDDAGVAATAKDLVAALNTALTTISTSTKYDVASRKGGPLTGDGQARNLQSRLMDAVTNAGASSATTLTEIGLRLERNGTYTFDEAAFTASLAKNATGTGQLVGALSTALGALAKEATTSTSATATSPATTGVTLQGKASSSERAAHLQKLVDAYDRRLEMTETRLRRQFTELDTALGQLKNQGSWLSGQLGSLPRW